MKASKYIFMCLIAGAASAAFYLLYAPQAGLPSNAAREFSLEVDGLERTFVVVVPQGLQPNPGVILAFHPSQGNANEMRRVVGHVLEDRAQTSNVIVVYPNGFEGHFNDCRKTASYSARIRDIDDVTLAERILQSLAGEYGADLENVFALGYSNGGHMAIRLGLERPDLVSGIALVAANVPTNENMGCSPVHSPVGKVVLIEGTEDPINPFTGGEVTLFGFGNRGTVLSAHDSAKWFVDALKLQPAGARSYADSQGVVAKEVDWRSENGVVRLVAVEGGGHTVPQGSYGFPRLFGKTFRSDQVLVNTWLLFFSEDK